MQRYFSSKKKDDYLELNEKDLYHIKIVMRMKENDFVEVVYNEELYICKVGNSNLVQICEKVEELNDSIDVTLVIPVLKENKMALIVQKATELGVKKIIPYIAQRGVVKLEENKIDKKIERWQMICKEASEQSKRLDIPIIEKVSSLDSLKEIDGVKLVCSTTKKCQNLKFFLPTTNKCVKIILAIGPEGGFTPQEEEILVSCNFERVSLGNRIMRVETVPLFLLCVINYVYME